jgi:putative transcriptional regulator
MGTSAVHDDAVVNGAAARSGLNAGAGSGAICAGAGLELTIAAMGESRVSLTHHFLIAMPSMADPHFAHTLIYVCEHNDQGELGIVVNKPIDMTL